jgi:hypothetical protein
VRKVIVPEFVSLDGVLILTHESTASDSNPEERRPMKELERFV